MSAHEELARSIMGSIVGWLSYGTDLAMERPTVSRMVRGVFGSPGDVVEPWVTSRLAMAVRPQAPGPASRGMDQVSSTRTAAGAVAVGMSGELHNRALLGAALRRRGHRVASDDDAHLVLHSYLEWSESMPEHLDGVFAIAIWDERVRRLVLVRDRLGVEPLYYCRLDDGVVFGSEPAALFANGRVRRQVDLVSMREIFTFTTSRDSSLWKGLCQVEPGSLVAVADDGIRSRIYWRPATRAHTDDWQCTVDHVRERLTTVVRERLSDMTPCILLSGGLDSSALAGLAASQLDGTETLHTFSVDFTSATGGAQDAPFAQDVARLVGSEHHRLAFTSSQLADPELRRKVIMARGGPVSWGDGDVSLYLAFTQIRRSHRVVLSGDCADTIFGFHPSVVQPAFEARVIPWLGSGLRDFWAQSLRPQLRKALDLPTHMREQYERAIAEVEHLPGADPVERRMREIAYLELGWHIRTVLYRRDRIARITGLNVRVPFCDRELIEYMYNVPWSLKTYDGREKSVLRHAVLDLIPDSVAQRSKRGYPHTMDAHYVEALQGQGKEILADPRHPVFTVVDRGWLERAVEAPIPEESPSLRFGLDRALDLYHWLELYDPELLID